MARGKRRRSTRVVAREAKERKIADVSRETIRRTFHESDLNPFHRKKIPRLLPLQRKKRKAFAIANEDKDWTKTVFSDEKKFILFDVPNRHNDIVWCGHPDEVPPIEMEKWKVEVHVWGAISSRGPLALQCYEPNLNASSYQELLARSRFIEAAEEEFGDDWEFQQDGATSHTAYSGMVEGECPIFHCS